MFQQLDASILAPAVVLVFIMVLTVLWILAAMSREWQPTRRAARSTLRLLGSSSIFAAVAVYTSKSPARIGEDAVWLGLAILVAVVFMLPTRVTKAAVAVVSAAVGIAVLLTTI